MSYDKGYRLIGKKYWDQKVHPMGSTPDYKAKRKHIDPEGYKKFLKKAGLNPHVHTKTQLKKMTKIGLIRLVIKLEKFIVNHAYEMYKAKLPRLKTIKQKALPKRKTKSKKKNEKLTKAEKKRRQKKLSAINKWRTSQGMKRIVVR